MRVIDLMTRHVISAHPDSSLAEAAERMRARPCGFLPIVDRESGTLCGVITDRDICMEALARERPLEELVVRDAMSHPVRTCLLEDDLATAHARMRKHHVRRLVVTDGAGALVGVLSLDDLAQVTTRHSPGATAEDLAQTLRAARPA